MIGIEIDESGVGVEILVDADGVDELIRYLKFVKSENEHMHLVAGSELCEELQNTTNRVPAAHARLTFLSD